MRVAPMRQVMIGREMWDLRADHCAWYTLELITKRSYRRTVGRLLNAKHPKLESLFLMLWALSSTHRVDQRIQIVESDEDRRLGTKVPLAFVRQVDASVEGIDALRTVVVEILAEAKLVTFGEQAREAKNPPPPPPSIGGGESTTPLPPD